MFEGLFITGTASDNVGVTRVEIVLYDSSGNTWDSASDSFTPAYTRFVAALNPPGDPAPSWQSPIIDPTPGLGFPAGDYTVGAQAFDAAGAKDPIMPWHHFTVN